MRPIRFRARDSSKGVMSEPFELGSQDSEYAWDEVMQFTGLVDKNGVEIYESFICNDEFGQPFIVVWVNEEARFGKRYTRKPAFGIPDPIYLFRKAETCEVIGNIYENPELL